MGTVRALHIICAVWTDTLIDPIDDDNAVTTPYLKALPDPRRQRQSSHPGSSRPGSAPAEQQLERRLERMDRSMERLHDQELEQSYLAALRNFR